jgi:hypothetical protein
MNSFAAKVIASQKIYFPVPDNLGVRHHNIHPTMLTPEQASVIADAVLEEQRGRIVASKNRRARRVRWFYQVPGLSSREPYAQADLFAAARLRVSKSVPYWCAVTVWLGLFALAWYWVAPRPALGALSGVVSVCVVWMIRIPFLRSQLADLVSETNSDEKAP